MKCYVLKKGQAFHADKTPKAEIPAALEQEILTLCSVWQARDLHQEGPNPDDYEGRARKMIKERLEEINNENRM